MNQKGFTLTLLLLVVLAILLVAWFVLRPTNLKNYQYQTPSSSVKQSQTLTYQDQELQLIFNYPVGFKVVADDEQSYFKRAGGDIRRNFAGYVGYQPPQFIKGVVLKGISDNSLSEFDSSPLTLWVFDNLDKLTPDSWYNKFWYYPFVWGEFAQPQKGQNAPQNEASVSGVTAKSATISYQPGKPKFIYLAKNNQMFLLKIINQNPVNLGDQVLKSLKFLDQTPK